MSFLMFNENDNSYRKRRNYKLKDVKLKYIGEFDHTPSWKFYAYRVSSIEDTIVRSTIIDGIDNLGSDNYNNHKYCDTSDILASTKLIEYIKSIIMEKI